MSLERCAYAFKRVFHLAAHNAKNTKAMLSVKKSKADEYSDLESDA